jgi:hypothetical protein
MRWFHPVGGPVLLLPAKVVPRWRGQSPETGFSAAYERVVSALGRRAWRGLDVGGLALAEVPDVGLVETDRGLTLFLGRCAGQEGAVAARAPTVEAAVEGPPIPWPGGGGALLDALENGDGLDASFNPPLPVQAPAGPWRASVGHLHAPGVTGLVLHLRPE